MKNLLVTCLLLILALGVQSQPLHDDTVVCIIDTTKAYVQYWDNPNQRDNYQFPPHWKIKIDGHYYDHTSSDKESAFWVFEAGLWNGVKGVEGFPKKKVLKKEIEERYFVVDDEWINIQTSLRVLEDSIGMAPWDKYNYIIFSQDYYCTDSDSVTMHRVEVGWYGNVQY
jgi:hypothetical protein